MAEGRVLRHFHQRVAEKARDVTARAVVIVAFGDSVTQGFTSAGKIEAEAVYHRQLQTQLEQRYPHTTFNVINAGVAGHTATDSLARLDRDVIRYQPDLVLIAFGLNDAVTTADDPNLLSFKTAIETMISQLESDTSSDVILLTPNFMVSADNANIDSSERHYLEALLPVQTGGALATCAQAIREVAAALHIPLVDVHRAWDSFAEQGIDTNMLLANGLNHPNAEAHRLAARLLMELIEGAQRN